MRPPSRSGYRLLSPSAFLLLTYNRRRLYTAFVSHVRSRAWSRLPFGLARETPAFIPSLNDDLRAGGLRNPYADRERYFCLLRARGQQALRQPAGLGGQLRPPPEP